jgi:hypothetical protein
MLASPKSKLCLKHYRMKEQREEKAQEAIDFMKKKRNGRDAEQLSGGGLLKSGESNLAWDEANYSSIFTTINSHVAIGKEDTDAFYEKFKNWIDDIFGTNHIVDFFKSPPPDAGDFVMSDQVEFESKYAIEVGKVDRKIHFHGVLHAKFPKDQRLQLNLNLLRELYRHDFGTNAHIYAYGTFNNQWKLEDYVFKQK